MLKNSLRFVICLIVVTAISIYPQGSSVKNTALTIYNSNLGLVKETRSIMFNKGVSPFQVTDVAQLIDPTTVRFGFDGQVLEQNYQYDLVSMDKILGRYIDKDIQLLGKQGELIEGKLLSIYGNQVVLMKKEGGLLMLPDASQYRINVASLPDGLITRPTLQCIASVAKQGEQEVQLSYQTAGMGWHAEYVAVLDKANKKMDLNSWVSIENRCGTSFKNSEIKLIAGDIHQAEQAPRMFTMEKSDNAVMRAGVSQFKEDAFFEYHLYTLDRKADVLNNETKQISLFEKSDISIVKKYQYMSYGSNTENAKADVIIEFANKENNHMGVPMPKGKVRIFQASDNSVELVGEDMLDHTPKDEAVTLKVGRAFDVVVKETATDNQRISQSVNDITTKFEIKNRKSEDIIIEIKKQVYGNWQVINASEEYTKDSATQIGLKVKVKAGEEKPVTIKVRYTY